MDDIYYFFKETCENCFHIWISKSHSRPQSLRFFWSRGRGNGRLPLVNDIKPEDEWLWGREWLSVAIISNFEQTRHSFCLQKKRDFQSSDLKMLQHGGYTEREEVNRTNKRQRR